MSGKGRVKDLVEKLNSKCAFKRSEFSKSTPSLNELRDDLDASNAKKRLQESKIPNRKITTKTTKNESNNDDVSVENVGKNNSTKSEINSTDDNWIKLVGVENLYKILTEKHETLQQSYCQLKKKYAEEEIKRQSVENELETIKTIKPPDTSEELKHLREKENRLMSEVQELREQNELLEFRLLELEYFNNGSKTETSTIEEITERDDVSDSGVISLSPCEDFFSECDLQDIKLDEEEPRVTGNEVLQKLTRMFQYAENTSDKIVVQQAIDLIKHYQMRITGMEATLTNMCQERFNQHSEEFLINLKNPEESARSKVHRVIATVPPFTNQSNKCFYSMERLQDVPPEKLFLEIDRLQESGIFDEFLEHDFIEKKSKETQTEFQDHISDFSVSGLVDELNKLEKIKRRIEERGNQSLFLSTEIKDCVKIVPNVPDSKKLSYYKQQYDILKSKLSAYETSNDSEVKQLTDLMHRENDFKNRVKYLTSKIAKMEADMKKLEEEKCEYEEAENDTRLRCQKLEVKLYALAEKKNDLQFQLQQHLRIISNLKNTLTELETKKDEIQQKSYQMEITINELEERNFELEERELDLRYKLQMLENLFPLLTIWNVYVCLTHFQRYIYCRQYTNALPQPTVSNTNSISESQNDELKNQIRHLERDLREKENLISKLKDYELELRSRIIELEENVNYLTSKEPPTHQWPTHKPPKTMKRIRELELKEEVYVQTLQQADEMIADMENDFKKKLEEMENALIDKGWKLQECERKLAAISLTRDMENHLMEKVQNLESEITILKQVIRIKEEEKSNWLENEKLLKEEIENLNSSLLMIKRTEEETKRRLEEERNIVKDQKEELIFKEKFLQDLEINYASQIKQLEKKIQRLTREIENHEVTNSELKEEVDTLEGAICELNLTLNQEKDEKEKILVKFRQELAMKQQEIDSLKRLSQDMTAISTAQEISLVQKEKRRLNSLLSNKYSNILPKIVPTNENKNNNRFNIGKLKPPSEKTSMKTESSAHVIRHKDKYTILLKPLPIENYSNFEVSINNSNPNIYQFKTPKLIGSIIQNDTISLTVKPI